MKRFTLAITEDDILTAVRFRIGNPILFVLQRATRTLWRINDDGTLAEVMTPFRTCLLSPAALEWWREYSRHGAALDGEIEVQVLSGSSDHGGAPFRPHSRRTRKDDGRHADEPFAAL